MKARDSFDAPPPRQPGRVRRVDLFLSVRETDVPEIPAVPEIVGVPGVPEVAEVLDPETGEVLTAYQPAIPEVVAVPGVPAVPATVKVDYLTTYQYHRPDENGSDDYCAGGLRPHLTATRKGHVKALLDWCLTKANGEV